MSLWVKNLLLAILVVALIAVPLYLIQGAEWGATDGRNTEAIQELQPDYEPWFAPLSRPPRPGSSTTCSACRPCWGRWCSRGWWAG